MVGSGNGEIAILDPKSKYKREFSCQVRGAVMSIQIRGNGHQIFCGTKENNVYRINIGKKAMKLDTNGIVFSTKLLYKAHYKPCILQIT